MRLPAVGPLTVIRWATRLVYVVLFISFLVVFGRLDDPRSYLFLGSVLCLIIPALFALKNDIRRDEEST